MLRVRAREHARRWLESHRSTEGGQAHRNVRFGKLTGPVPVA